jgi:hypothetical protein
MFFGAMESISIFANNGISNGVVSGGRGIRWIVQCLCRHGSFIQNGLPWQNGLLVSGSWAVQDRAKRHCADLDET